MFDHTLTYSDKAAWTVAKDWINTTFGSILTYSKQSRVPALRVTSEHALPDHVTAMILKATKPRQSTFNRPQRDGWGNPPHTQAPPTAPPHPDRDRYPNRIS